jgi:hypothetical protein
MAVHTISSGAEEERGSRWVPDLEEVPPAAKELLASYSNIPEEEMLSHIVETVCLKRYPGFEAKV